MCYFPQCKTVVCGEDGDLVEKSMGTFGPWHLKVFIGLLFVKIPIGAHLLGIVFLTPPVSFSCTDNTKSQCDDDCPGHNFNRYSI